MAAEKAVGGISRETGAWSAERPRAQSGVSLELAAVAGRLTKARRTREMAFPGRLCSNPAWDILLDLYVAMATDQPVSIATLCLASAAPTSTALRWVNALVDEGAIERRPDTHDERRTWLRLSDEGVDRMNRCLAAFDFSR